VDPKLAAVVGIVTLLPALYSQSADKPALSAFDRVRRIDVQSRRGVHHATCRGRVVDLEGDPVAETTVALLAAGTPWGVFPVTRTKTDEDGRFVLHDITHPGQSVLWIGWPAQSWRIELIDGAVTDLRTLRLEKKQATPKSVRVSGRVVTPDGEALPGVVVIALGGDGEFDPAAFARTGRDGRYGIDARVAACKGLLAFPSGRRIRVQHESREAPEWRVGFGGRQTLHADLGKPVEMRLPGMSAVELSASGIAGDVTYEWHDGVSWAPLAGAKAWLWQSEYGSSLRVRALVSGHLPRAAWVELARTRVSKAGEKKRPSQYEFDFTGDEKRVLRVASAAGALPKANVDIDVDGTPLAGFVTDDKGELTLQAAKDTGYEVYAYAPGHAGGRRLWRRTSTELVLAPRSARVGFSALDGVTRIRVKRAGSEYAVAHLTVDGRSQVTTELAPGRYDATFLDADWKVRRATRFGAVAGKLTEVPERDDRPVVLVGLPSQQANGSWSVQGSRSAHGMHVTGWMAMSGGGGRTVVFEPTVEVEKVDDRHYRLEFVSPGSFVVSAGANKLGFNLYREVHLEARQRLRLEVPELLATLKGSRRTYHPWSAQHGVAGPRFILLADVEAQPKPGFHVVVSLPGGVVDVFEPGQSREAHQRFELKGLPIGDYHAFAHLIGRDEKRKDHTFNQPVYAYGGIKVALRAGKTTKLVDFADPERGKLRVVVLDKSGRPVDGARVSIRDRMYEFWRQVEEGGTTLRYASDAIVPPPSAVLEDGRATLPEVRAGRLELTVELDDGRIVEMTRDVEPGTLTLRLPIDA